MLIGKTAISKRAVFFFTAVPFLGNIPLGNTNIMGIFVNRMFNQSLLF